MPMGGSVLNGCVARRNQRCYALLQIIRALMHLRADA